MKKDADPTRDQPADVARREKPVPVEPMDCSREIQIEGLHLEDLVAIAQQQLAILWAAEKTGCSVTAGAVIVYEEEAPFDPWEKNQAGDQENAVTGGFAGNSPSKRKERS